MLNERLKMVIRTEQPAAGNQAKGRNQAVHSVHLNSELSESPRIVHRLQRQIPTSHRKHRKTEKMCLHFLKLIRWAHTPQHFVEYQVAKSDLFLFGKAHKSTHF